MTTDDTREGLTDDEWREFQSIPDQGYSHRGWVDQKIAAHVAAVVVEQAAEVERLTAQLGAIAALADEADAEAESRCADCGEPIVRVDRRQIVFHPTMPSFTEWMHEGWRSNEGYWCDGGNVYRAHPSAPTIDLDHIRAILADPAGAIAKHEQEVEYGVAYVRPDGTPAIEWGFARPPVVDADGEVELGLHEYVEATAIKRRPKSVEETVCLARADAPTEGRE